MSRIAFLDCEASSLDADSYPIEIGWILDDGTGASCLIRPEEKWVDWSFESAKVHGISPVMLARDGLSAADAGRMAYEALEDCVVHADSSWDGIWLHKLTHLANLPTIRVWHPYDLYSVEIAPLVAGLPRSSAESLAARIIRRAEEASDRQRTGRHRALDDARYLYDVWRGVQALAADAAG